MEDTLNSCWGKLQGKNKASGEKAKFLPYDTKNLLNLAYKIHINLLQLGFGITFPWFTVFEIE